MEKNYVAYHPWEHIQDELDARGWTQKQFAILLWISQNEVNDIIKWRRNVTARLAMRIWKAFWTSAWMRLWLQNSYEIYSFSKNKKEVAILDKIPHRMEELALA